MGPTRRHTNFVEQPCLPGSRTKCLHNSRVVVLLVARLRREQRTVRSVFYRSAGGVVGIAPLYWERRKFLGFRPTPGTAVDRRWVGDSDDLDFIVKPGYAAAVAKALLKLDAPGTMGCVRVRLPFVEIRSGRRCWKMSCAGSGWKRATSHLPVHQGHASGDMGRGI